MNEQGIWLVAYGVLFIIKSYGTTQEQAFFIYGCSCLQVDSVEHSFVTIFPNYMKIFDMDGKIKLLCLVYFMVAQSSMMARATSDSFLLKYFQVESIPLMIMAAASLSIILAIFTTYLCGRFQAYGAMKIATLGLVFILCVVIALVFLLGSRGEAKSIYVFAYMICEVIVILPMVLFWGMAVGVLNPTESKKWMGMIGAAGTCGCILAGYTISWVSKEYYVNELSLGLVAAVLLVVHLSSLLARSYCQSKTRDPSLFRIRVFYVN